MASMTRCPTLTPLVSVKSVGLGRTCRYYLTMDWPTDLEVERWLRSRLAVDGGVTLAGAGSWSKCWSFTHSARLLLAKIGPHHDDLRADVLAARWSSDVLPIPAILESGEAFDAGFVIMEYKPGAPPEASSADAWGQLIPSVVDLLEGLRTADVSQLHGWGCWTESMHGNFDLQIYKGPCLNGALSLGMSRLSLKCVVSE
jgi:hypothetical protein